MWKVIRVIIYLILFGPIVFFIIAVGINELSSNLDFGELKTGMTESQVEKVMGKPKYEFEKLPAFCDQVFWVEQCATAEQTDAVRFLMWKSGIDHAYLVGVDEQGQVVFLGQGDT